VIPVATTRDRKVDGQQQGAALRFTSLREQIADKASILDDVELEPEGRL
jgi:hypothetical protein